jgi:hypothetical protein
MRLAVVAYGFLMAADDEFADEVKGAVRVVNWLDGGRER